MKDAKYQKTIQITIHSDESILPGDEVKVFGTIDRATDFITDTGRLFPYQEYEVSKGIVGIISNGSITIISPGTF